MTATDARTTTAVVILQDRPLIPLTPWIAAALRECAESGRTLHLVSPPTSRITLALKIALTSQQARWIVHDAPAYYDGLTGELLTWNGTQFAPESDRSPTFLAPTPPPGSQLTLTLHTRYAPADGLGHALDHLCTALSEGPPTAWGPAEPAAYPWNLAELTRYCQSRPDPTWLVLIGNPAFQGTVLYTPVPNGFEESATLVIGYPRTTPPPVAGLPSLAADLAADHHILSLSAQMAPGSPDLTTAPHWTGPSAPIGLALSPELGGGNPVPPDIPSRQTGSLWWYDLGDGVSPATWPLYHRLLTHLSPASPE